MTRFGWFECLCLVFFGFSAMAAFLTGGMKWVGWVAEVFLWTSFLWLGKRVCIEYWDELKADWERMKAFQEWRKLQRNRLKGME